MQSPTFTSVAHQMQSYRETQKYKYNYTYNIPALINPGQTKSVFLVITQDADFFIEKFTGSAYGPVDTSGIPIQANTDFPMPGIAVGQGFAGRGVNVFITDTGNGRDLTNGFTPVETLLTPGYGTQLFLPYPIKYFCARNSRIRFDFRNQDTQARHQVTMVFNGYKFQMPQDAISLAPQDAVINAAQVAQR